MAIKICPRCKLNYVKPGMKYCKVCMKDFDDIEDDREVCPMCGENPLEEGQDLCSTCLKSRIDMSGYTLEDGNVAEDAETDDDDMDGMRLVDLDEDGQDSAKDNFDK